MARSSADLVQVKPSSTLSSISSHPPTCTQCVDIPDDNSCSGSTSSAASSPTYPSLQIQMTLEAAMSEVETRFLLNLPEEELASVERLFFQLEQAHWYYEDFLADQHPNLPHFELEGFTQEFFKHSELLLHLQERHTDLVQVFHAYKYTVPVYGCVLLSPNMDKVLFVCNWGGNMWSLPRGKINEGEKPIDCAARETLEECGYDVSGRLHEADSITLVQNTKRVKMYIVRDVPEDFPFKPQVRKEISQVRFFPLNKPPALSYHVKLIILRVGHWLDRQQRRRVVAARRDIREKHPRHHRQEGGVQSKEARRHKADVTPHGSPLQGRAGSRQQDRSGGGGGGKGGGGRLSSLDTISARGRAARRTKAPACPSKSSEDTGSDDTSARPARVYPPQQEQQRGRAGKAHARPMAGTSPPANSRARSVPTSVRTESHPGSTHAGDQLTFGKTSSDKGGWNLQEMLRANENMAAAVMQSGSETKGGKETVPAVHPQPGLGVIEGRKLLSSLLNNHHKHHNTNNNSATPTPFCAHNVDETHTSIPSTIEINTSTAQPVLPNNPLPDPIGSSTLSLAFPPQNNLPNNLPQTPHDAATHKCPYIQSRPLYTPSHQHTALQVESSLTQNSDVKDLSHPQDRDGDSLVETCGSTSAVSLCTSMAAEVQETQDGMTSFFSEFTFDTQDILASLPF